jgi:raffinose/stachyose/melibiose transport system permease protein
MTAADQAQIDQAKRQAQAAAHPARSRAARRNLQAYMLVAPALILFAFFIVYPISRTIFISFQDVGITDTRSRFVGLGNYAEMMGDRIFWRSIRNNVTILVVSVLFQVGGGLILAAVLQRGIRTGRAFFRTLHFAPVIMSVVAVGLLWQLVYDPGMGILNKVLNALSLPVPKQGWLGDPQIVVYAILVAACWQYTGYIMVIVLAGMQSVNESIYESARLDGANEVQLFFRITIPIIRNVIIVATLLTMVGAFKVFDIVFVLTRGGPANASQVLGTYIYYNAFTVNRAGYASALAVVLLVVAIALGMIQLRFSKAVGGGES